MRTYGTSLRRGSFNFGRYVIRGLPQGPIILRVSHPQSVRLGAPLDKRGRFVLHGVVPGVYDIELTWLDDALSSKDSASYPLR